MRIAPELLAGFIVFSFSHTAIIAQQDDDAELEENSISLLNDYSSVTDEVL